MCQDPFIKIKKQKAKWNKHEYLKFGQNLYFMLKKKKKKTSKLRQFWWETQQMTEFRGHTVYINQWEILK